MVRSFLRDDDLSPAEQAEVLELALRLKQDRFAERPLEGPKTVAVLFDKTSTRTRVSFAVGISELGGYPLIIDSGSSQLGAKESVADTARVLGRQVEAIVWRTYAQDGLEEMAEHSGVSVVNSLSDDFHPCQLLADLLTVKEHFGDLAGRALAYVGDASNNMAHSYLLASATAGMHVRVAGPANYQPNPEVVARAKEIAEQTGGSVSVGVDAAAAVAEADVVTTDTWISMGQESEKDARIAAFGDYSVTAELFAKAAPDAVFLHCLPAYRGYEVAAEVIDGPQSLIWDEAENRLHAQKALLVWLLA
ncbi:MAG: ornithine carbamoyltransferase [Microbacteriaceae bacterium]|nr:ornithine carbamoyltransferase [Microbacteriaceae bacterium]